MFPAEKRSRGRIALRLVLTILGLAVLTWLAWSARHDLARLIITSDPIWLLIAIGAGVVFTMTQGLLFADLVRKHVPGGERRNFVAAFLLSQPAKYIPGKIWSPLLQVLALRNGSALASVTIANVELAAIATIQVTALGVALVRVNSPFAVCASLIVGLLLAVAVAILPTGRITVIAFPRIARALGIVVAQQTYEPCPAWRMPLICAASMVTNLIASYLVLYAAGVSVPYSARHDILGSLYLGFAVSMLAIPIPAGLGVREGAAAGIASLVVPGIPASLIISAAVLFRCWQVFVDVACLGVGALMVRSRTSADGDTH